VETVEIWMFLQIGGGEIFDNPADKGAGKGLAQKMQSRKGVDHVPNGAAPDDENSRRMA
jgi:hypothetical protein